MDVLELVSKLEKGKVYQVNTETYSHVFCGDKNSDLPSIFKNSEVKEIKIDNNQLYITASPKLSEIELENKRLIEELHHIKDLWRYSNKEDIFENLPLICEKIIAGEEWEIWVIGTFYRDKYKIGGINLWD